MQLDVLARQLVRGLELPVLAPDLRVALAVGDHLRIGHLALELREAALDLVDELLDHALSVTPDGAVGASDEVVALRAE